MRASAPWTKKHCGANGRNRDNQEIDKRNQKENERHEPKACGHAVIFSNEHQFIFQGIFMAIHYEGKIFHGEKSYSDIERQKWACRLKEDNRYQGQCKDEY